VSRAFENPFGRKRSVSKDVIRLLAFLLFVSALTFQTGCASTSSTRVLPARTILWGGFIGDSGKWSQFPEYYVPMMKAIQADWDHNLIDSKTPPPSGTRVTVKMTVDRDGNVTDIIDLENTSSELGKRSCLDAITSAAPFGHWTPGMVAVLGNSQAITFEFYYS
jgi:hypothetical protein